MRKAYEKGNALLDSSLRKRAQPLLNFTNHVQLIPKQKSDLQLLDLANTHDLKLIHQIGTSHPNQPPAVVNHPYQDTLELLMQLITSPIHSPHTPAHSLFLTDYGNTLYSENSLMAVLSDYPARIDEQLKQPQDNVIYLDRYNDSNSYITEQQLNDFFAQRHVEIELLKRTLLVARKRLSANEVKLNDSILERQSIHQQHDYLKTELQILHSKHQQREFELQTTLDEVRRSAHESLTDAKTEIAQLRQSIEAKEASRQQLQQEKAILANSLQTETTRNLEFVQQSRLLEERLKGLELILKTTQHASKEAELAHNKTMAAIKQELEQALSLNQNLSESHQQLNESLRHEQTDAKRQQERMRQALETEKRHSEEEQKRLNSVIFGLNQQLEANQSKAERQLEEARQQARAGSQMLLERMNQALANEKQHAREEQTRLEKINEELTQKLQKTRAEADRQLDEAQRQTQADIRSLHEQMDQTMEQALAAEKQLANEERIRFVSAIQALNQQLEENRIKSDQALDEAQRQAQVDIQSLQERMNHAKEQALTAEKQLASEEQARYESEIKALNQQLEQNHTESEQQLEEANQQAQAEYRLLQDQLKTIRAEARKQQDKLFELETFLEQERITSSGLRDLQKTTEKALLESNKRLSETKQSYQERLSELQHKLTSNKDTLSRLERSEHQARTANQDFSSQREELEQKITHLQAQLEQQRLSNEETINNHEEKSAQLEQSLFEIQEKAKRAEDTIQLLKKTQQTQNDGTTQLEDQLATLKAESRTEQTQLRTSCEAERKEKESLQQQLEHLKAQREDSTELQKIKEENDQLKLKIKGMREVQRDMESQLVVDGDDEIRKLHNDLKATQAKLKNALKLAKQSKDLMRENQIHESAINILSEDLDELTEEKNSLLKERDALKTELAKVKQLHTKPAGENCPLH
jgi:chromosome segregation ATPase